MGEFDEMTQCSLDLVLEAVCSELSNGGDDESRKVIAEHLVKAARQGKTSFIELNHAARRALLELQGRRFT